MDKGDESKPEPEASPDAESGPDEESGPDVFAGDDNRAKFREALARKAGGPGKGDAAGPNASKIGSAHGPAKAQRTFRRKSGG